MPYTGKDDRKALVGQENEESLWRSKVKVKKKNRFTLTKGVGWLRI